MSGCFKYTRILIHRIPPVEWKPTKATAMDKPDKEGNEKTPERMKTQVTLESLTLRS